MIERLDSSQFATVVRFLEFLLLDPFVRPILTAPLDDEPLSETEELTLDRAHVWLQERGGEGIPHDAVLAEFGLTIHDFPPKRMAVEWDALRRSASKLLGPVDR